MTIREEIKLPTYVGFFRWVFAYGIRLIGLTRPISCHNLIERWMGVHPI